MTSETPRRMRADAERNVERILRAARETFASSGPDAPLDEIARRAGVGIATLYRRFSDRDELVRTAIEHSVAEMVSPAAEKALDDVDPLRGLTTLLNAALSVAARERNTLAAANDFKFATGEIARRLFETAALLTRRGQAAGVIRTDLVPDDVATLMGMIASALWTTNPDDDGWRRYVVLLLDSLRPEGATPLPPARPLPWSQRDWRRPEPTD